MLMSRLWDSYLDHTFSNSSKPSLQSRPSEHAERMMDNKSETLSPRLTAHRRDVKAMLERRLR
jgi:hypothetical protein